VITLLHAIVYGFLHNLLNIQVQIANKMGLQKMPCNGCCVIARTINTTITLEIW
jgi:hypothetical protein